MIGAIAGDIIGSRFEGDPAPPEDFALFHPSCRFTDDTVCAFAVADAVMTGADFAATLREYVRRHPDRGYGGMFRKWAFADNAPAYGSWGNGAPMRVASVGWLAENAERVDALAQEQAAVSHDHPDAIAASRAVARAIFALRQGEEAASVRDWLTRTFGYDLRPETALAGSGFDASAAGTVPAALAAAFSATDWEAAIRRVIRRGGDTDTLACICGGVAEPLHGVPTPIADRARDYLTADLRAVLEHFETQIGR